MGESCATPLRPTSSDELPNLLPELFLLRQLSKRNFLIFNLGREMALSQCSVVAVDEPNREDNAAPGRGQHWGGQ